MGPADEVSAVPGHGVVGVVGRRPARLGKPAFIDPGPLAPEVVRLQAAGATVVVVEHDGRLLGAIAVRDELRPEAQEAVAGLRDLGISTVAMLTGDNPRTAVAVAAAAGIVEVHGDLLPEDKVVVVEEMQRRQAVAMVGDGINDAPALATARVGIAMGAMGVDAAIETAGVALMGEDLRRLPEALAHARRAVRILRQNLALSAAILLLLVPTAAAGVLGLAAVVAVHELAEVLVIANGVRAGRWRPAREARAVRASRSRPSSVGAPTPTLRTRRTVERSALRRPAKRRGRGSRPNHDQAFVGEPLSPNPERAHSLGGENTSTAWRSR
jgi:cation-transporting ATPase G